MYAEVIRDKNNNLTYRTLAGAASDGFPLGTIVAMYTTSVPTGFLPCTGVEFDIEQYPALYVLLGSNKTPDLREAALRGIGLSTREAIQTHDVYTLGQFKDDAIALNTTGIITNGSGEVANMALVKGKATGSSTASVTRGKSVGVNYIIKATIGSIAVGDPDVYNQVIAFLDDNYIKDDIENYRNGCLIKYDETINKFVPVETPTISNSVLTAEVESYNDWSFNGQKYDKDIVAVENEEEPSASVEIGRMTTSRVAKSGVTRSTYYCFMDVLAEVNYYYNTNAIPVPDPNLYPEHFLSEEQIRPAIRNPEDEALYMKDDGVYYKIVRFNDDTPILEEVTDASVISVLDTLQTFPIWQQRWIRWDNFVVGGFKETGFEVGSPLTPDYNTPDSAYLPVYCNTYYGSNFTYKWATQASSKGVAFIGTRAQYEIAKRIAEGQEGHIPSGALVIITDEKSTLIGEDQ